MEIIFQEWEGMWMNFVPETSRVIGFAQISYFAAVSKLLSATLVSEMTVVIWLSELVGYIVMEISGKYFFT